MILLNQNGLGKSHKGEVGVILRGVTLRYAHAKNEDIFHNFHILIILLKFYHEFADRRERKQTTDVFVPFIGIEVRNDLTVT